MRTHSVQIHPLSIVTIFTFIFLATHLQLQKREKSYRTSESLKELRQLKEKKTQLEIQKSKLQGPSHVQKVAESMTLRKASFDQVIIMAPIRDVK
jgi:hypothetical protein